MVMFGFNAYVIGASFIERRFYLILNLCSISVKQIKVLCITTLPLMCAYVVIQPSENDVSTQHQNHHFTMSMTCSESTYALKKNTSTSTVNKITGI